MFATRLGSCLIVCSVMFLPAQLPAAEAKPGLPVVVLLGDSIRMQYQNAVRSELSGKAVVWSPKENCSHTAFTLARLEQWVKGRHAAVVHINVGLHDLFLNANTNLPRHSLDVYATNLRAIFTKLKALTDADIIFALTTPVHEERQTTAKSYGRVVRRNSDVAAYNAKAAEIAQALGVRINDLHAALQGGGETMISRDGVHLSRAGIGPAAKQVAQCVLAALADRAKR